MNEFVNYGKRTVDLPDGCSDLMEVLRAKAAPGSPGLPPAISTETMHARGLASIKKYVLRMLRSTAHSVVFILARPGDVACVLERTELGPVMKFPLKPPHIFPAAQIRRCCGEAGLLPIMDSETLGRRFLAFELPTLAIEATRLIQRILHEVYGVTEDAPLIFHSVDGRHE